MKNRAYPHENTPGKNSGREKGRIRLSIRVLVLGYLLWPIWQMARLYRSGESGVSPTVAVLSLCVFSIAAIAVAISVFRLWSLEKRRASDIPGRDTDSE